MSSHERMGLLVCSSIKEHATCRPAVGLLPCASWKKVSSYIGLVLAWLERLSRHITSRVSIDKVVLYAGL